MAKKVHIILSRKSWEELRQLEKSFIKPRHKTYEEYLEEEKHKPTMALFS